MINSCLSYIHLIDSKLFVLLFRAIGYGNYELGVILRRMRVVDEAVAEWVVHNNLEREHFAILDGLHFSEHLLEPLSHIACRVALSKRIGLFEVGDHLGKQSFHSSIHTTLRARL